MAVKTPKEAVKALCVVLPGFEQFLNTSQRRGLTYSVFSGKRNLMLPELEMDNSSTDIRIAPVIIGSKQAGMFQTVLGVALVAIGAIVGVMTSWTGVGGVIGAGMVKVGSAMALGGVIQMLSPQAGGLASKQDADNKASYAFGGVTNTTAQGNPVPLLYGKRRIGGAIISAGIYAEDQQ